MCEGTRGLPFRSIRFKYIWVGLAGYDRPKIANIVNSALTELFQRPINDGLAISNDLDLLVAPSMARHHLNSAIVLIVGTGSVAMSYRKDESQFTRTGRSGGWGSLLGDDGSGYALGREGLRLALESADELNLNSTRSVDPLVEKIFTHFGIDTKSSDRVDLLDRILTSEDAPQQDLSTTKKKISGVSKIIVEEYVSSENARAIVQAGVKSVMRMLGLLINNGQINPSKSVLILAGGLMQNATYQNRVLEELSSSDRQFSYIQGVMDPAAEAAKYLLTKTR